MTLKEHRFLCNASALDGRNSLGVECEGTKLMLIRSGDTIRAYLNSCPHRGVPLDWGNGEFFDSGGELLLCSTHGALFLPSTGLCVAGPCQGSSLKSIALLERDGKLYCCDSASTP